MRMKKMVKRLGNFLARTGMWLRNHKYPMVGVVAVLGILVTIDPVLANDGVSGLDGIVLWLAGVIAQVVLGLMKLIVALIQVLLVPILRYDGFGTADIVTRGWVIVRDIVNMFFIVVLLVIAFQTIFGVGRSNWRQQVPRLLIMAIAINFSRTIASVLIDFSQVIMLTFVNAIKDVAGGNFIQYLGLDSITEFSQSDVVRRTDEGVGYAVFDFFVAAILSLVVTFVVLATILMMVALFAFRIVLLWILIIMSPLTFFLGGTKGVFSMGESYYADWWKRFISTAALGPIMTFFLWLALASAGSGTLATQQGFETQLSNNPEFTNISGIITKTFDSEHLTSLILGVALLFAGFEVSQSTAAGMGGRAAEIAQKGIRSIPGLSRSLARLSAAAPAIGVASGVAGVGIAGRYGLKNLAPPSWQENIDSVATWAGSGLQAVGSNETVQSIPFIRGLGRGVAGAGMGINKAIYARQEKERAEAYKSNEGKSWEELITTMHLTPTTREQKLQRDDAVLRIINSRKNISKRTKDMEPDKIIEALREASDIFASIKTELPSDVWDQIGKGGAMLLPQIFAGGEEDEEKAIRGIQQQLTSMASMRGGAAKIHANALYDPRVIEAALRTRSNRPGANNFLEEIEKYGREDQKIVLQKMRGRRIKELRGDEVPDEKKEGEMREPDKDKPGLRQRINNIRDGKDVDKNMEAIDTLIGKLSDIDVRGVDETGGVIQPMMIELMPQLAESIANNASNEAIQAAASNPAIVDAMQGAFDKQVAAANSSLSGADLDNRLVEIERARLRANSVPSAYNRDSGSFNSPGDRDRFIEAIRGAMDSSGNSAPEEIVVKLEELISAKDFGGQIALALANSVEPAGISRLQSRLIQSAGTPKEAQLKKYLSLLERSIRKHAAAVSNHTAKLDSLESVKQRLNIRQT